MCQLWKSRASHNSSSVASGQESGKPLARSLILDGSRARSSSATLPVRILGAFAGIPGVTSLIRAPNISGLRAKQMLTHSTQSFSQRIYGRARDKTDKTLIMRAAREVHGPRTTVHTAAFAEEWRYATACDSRTTLHSDVAKKGRTRSRKRQGELTMSSSHGRLLGNFIHRGAGG